MHVHRTSRAMVGLLVATQLGGPALLWAADQRGVRIEATRRVVVSALSGDQLTLQNGAGTKTLQFREGVAAGDRLTTGDRTMAEVLIGNRAVVTVGQGTSVQLTTMTPEQTTIQVSKGTVRVAAAASALGEQGLVTVQTPTGQVQTRGGIVRVLVDAPVRAADQIPTGEARPYLASYSPTIVAALSLTRGEIIQVEEGLAEIVGTGPGAKGVTLQSGQAITLQGGQAGPIAGITAPDTLKSGVVATAGHRSTPKEGMDNLVALQVDQATQLGNALTGAAETGAGESGKKDESGKALNGATGGVTLANAVANALFGNGSTANPTSGGITNTTGAGYGGNSNSGFTVRSFAGAPVNLNGSNALLAFTRMDAVAGYVKKDFTIDFGGGISTTYFKGEVCRDLQCFHLNGYNGHIIPGDTGNVEFKAFKSIQSEFTIVKELVLIGGAGNTGHGGIVPDERLVVRGAAATFTGENFTNVAAFFPGRGTGGFEGGLYPHDIAAGGGSLGTGQAAPEAVASNSTFVVQTTSTTGNDAVYRGGTLGQFSSHPDGIALINESGGPDVGTSNVDGAITATSSTAIPVVNLTGGVTLDQGTKATIGTTAATDNYFRNVGGSDAKFTGSLLSVINGLNNGVTTSVTVQDRLLGVYDGSTVCGGHPECGIDGSGNKALLSVLDAKLKGPGGSIPLIDIANGKHFAIDPDELVTPDKPRTVTTTDGSAPDVKVTSAVVVRSTIPLDGALLEASAPLLALTNATMTTASHFADLAGNQAQSIKLGDALVALNASQLLIQNGHLLNLNAATATVNGYLFSLTGGSTLTINNGALFSLNKGSSLTLGANAFGVFGSGANTLFVQNSLCSPGSCGQLVNGAGQAFQMPVGVSTGALSPILVAGTSKNVVLPSGFSPFAASGGSPAAIMGTSTTALFHVDETSTLTIGTTKVR
ncbi:MAG: hypothetical protein HOP35_13995 [Nitrospira sp.]|nr:hypothetical protein [Nitrospira sp.]